MEHFYRDIKGWFDFDNVYLDMVSKHDDGAHFVEVGVFLGKSLSFLAVEIINSGKKIKLDAIDTWEGSSLEPYNMEQPEVVNNTLYDDFLKNIEPVKNHINIIKSDSVEASKLYENNSLDFVYIDASHHYEFIKADILAWLPKVKIGGYIGGHDFDPPSNKSGGIFGVHQAVTELFPNNYEVIHPVSWLHKKTEELNAV